MLGDFFSTKKFKSFQTKRLGKSDGKSNGNTTDRFGGTPNLTIKAIQVLENPNQYQ